MQSDSTPPPHLRAENLTRSFQIGRQRIEVLRGVNLEVRRGECLFLCGASGAGKTTLLYTLAGMERPEGGAVWLGGRSLYAMGDSERARVRNAHMGFVFQGYFLLPELTAFENVLLPAMIESVDREDEAREALEAVGLGGRMEHLPAELSGGEQQRVAIARALINEPEVLFADEPTGNLDSTTGGEIIDLLLGLVRKEGRTLVVVTHDLGLAARGDRKIVIRDGQLEMT